MKSMRTYLNGQKVSGGAPNLADFPDVYIVNPADNQALLYDDTIDKWKNVTLADVAYSGEYSDLLNKPVVNYVSQAQADSDNTAYRVLMGSSSNYNDAGAVKASSFLCTPNAIGVSVESGKNTARFIMQNNQAGSGSYYLHLVI